VSDRATGHAGPADSGAAAILRTLVAAGVEHLFTNPGTTELAFVAAATEVPELQSVLVVDETVASGAADGAARMSGAPGAALLHLGPGLANAAANLHNAAKARSPLVTVVGDHASDHRHSPSPLQSDIEAIARPLSVWVDVTTSADDAATATARAIEAARQRRGPATLVVPADHAEQQTSTSLGAVAAGVASKVDDEAVRAAIDLLRSGDAALLLGGRALRADALALADRLAVAFGADLWAPMFNARVERTQPTARPLRKLPYFPTQAHQVLGGYRSVVAIDADEPLAVFAYPGEPRRLVPEGVVWHRLTDDGDDALAALAHLVDAAGVSSTAPRALVRRAAPEGEALDPILLAQAVAATMPDFSVVVDEAQTSSLGVWDALAGVPHDLLMLTGGAIGSGPPLATGAAFAAPGRRVVNLEGDGSALYSAGAWWTQARHGLDVTTVVAANRGYAILDLELARAGRRRSARGPLTRLDDPAVDFTALATAYGVPAVRVTSASALVEALHRSFATEGPYLIEACW
jgi:acetolactate synthase-1/2/3 large subunit